MRFHPVTHAMIVLCALPAGLCGPGASASEGLASGPIPIGSRLELFVDDLLIDRLEGAELRLHAPQRREIVLHYDRPWEGPFCGYLTVILDGATYRMYYRGRPGAGSDGTEGEVTCYAESADGIRWTKPALGLFEHDGTRENNIILKGHAPASHNFSPFLDARPGVPRSERFKALAGSRESGLMVFVSEDGIRWQKMQEEPVFTRGAFDSQNVAFWSESEGCYACYFRTWTSGEFAGYRTISRTTSLDFRTWSDPAPMEFGNAPPEHLYTNQTHPYFRAPHIYIAIPMRFLPGRKVLTEAQASALGVEPRYRGDCADAVFMTSRGGNRYARTFLEGFIRPGADLGNWASRAGLVGLGVVPTGPTEISIYKQAHYAQPTAHLVRYSLRTDGFVSVHAPYAGGTLVTRPLTWSGTELVVNFSTSAAGSIRVAVEDGAGRTLLGPTEEIIGDDVERTVPWPGDGLAPLAGKPVRLRFTLKDADLYSIRFR